MDIWIKFELDGFASFKKAFFLSKLTCVLANLSEPAKSTRFNLESVYFSLDDVTDLLSILMVNIQCDLELSLFKKCVPIDRLVSPF